MNWIRIAVGIMHDPSIHAVADDTGVSVPATTGHVVGVLSYLPSHARTGDVSSVPDATIERWAMWTGKRGKFAAAFRAHLCDSQGVVRSWDKHNGSMLREYDRQRDKQKRYRDEMRKYRESSRNRTGYVPGTVPQTSSGTERNGTERTTELHISDVADAPPAPLLVLNPEQPRATRRRAAAHDKAPAFPHFPVELCREMHALWITTFGACDYARFRKAMGSLFTIAESERPADAPTDRELVAALKSYADLAPMGHAARFANVNHAAGCLAAIARTRRELADAPDRRSDAVMRIIHGHAPKGAA